MTETPDKLPRILEPETKSWIERKAQGAPPYNRCDIKANDLLVAIDYIAALSERIEKLRDALREAQISVRYDRHVGCDEFYCGECLSSWSGDKGEDEKHEIGCLCALKEADNGK